MAIDLDSLVGEDLLSDEDIIDAFQSWFDLEATFFEEYEATFIIRSDIEPINNDSRKDSTTEKRVLIDKVLVVPDNKDNDAEIQISRKGKADFTEGAMYVFMRTLKRAGLTDDKGRPTILAEQDTVEFDGRVYDIFGVNRVAPFAGTYVLAKFQIKFEFQTR